MLLTRWQNNKLYGVSNITRPIVQYFFTCIYIDLIIRLLLTEILDKSDAHCLIMLVSPMQTWGL